MPMSYINSLNYKSSFPEMNVHNYDEPDATDTEYYDTLDINAGYAFYHLYVGTPSPVSDVYGMKIYKQFVNIFEDNILAQGEMVKLISDFDQY